MILFIGVMRSNEKSCVCNVFAIPYSKNPVKSSLPSYPNVHHTFLERTISKKIFNLSGFRFWEVLYCMKYLALERNCGSAQSSDIFQYSEYKRKASGEKTIVLVSGGEVWYNSLVKYHILSRQKEQL